MLAVSGPVDTLPLTASVPDQPPDAVQEVALVVVQVSMAALPLAMVLGLAVSATVGTGCVTDTVAACEALPPAPVQRRL